MIDSMKDRLPARDRGGRLAEVRLDATLAILSCIVAAEGRIGFYALAQGASAAEPLRITLVRDGVAFETIRLVPQDGLTAPDGTPLLHAESICMLQRDMATKGRIHAVCRGALVLETGATYVPRFKGRLDLIRDGRVSGWAIDLARGAATAEVEILVDGVAYPARPATVARPDVARVYPSHPACGFEFAIPLDGLPPARMTVRARIRGTSHDLAARDSSYVRAEAPPPPPQILVPGGAVTVILPLEGPAAGLRDCLAALLAHTRLGAGAHRLILSCAADADPALAGLVQDHADHDGITILRPAPGLGRTAAVNDAILAARALDPGGDVLLLGHRSRVTPQWLELLQRAARQGPFIGTVSALSDDAGAFSVPLPGHANPPPPWLDRDGQARLITQASSLRHLRVPATGGFCMYVQQAVFAAIGLFDADAFPDGPGAEEDFCLRAGHAGWEHVLADNVFIPQQGPAAPAALPELIAQAHPAYGLAVDQALLSNAGAGLARFAIAYEGLRHPQLPRPRLACVAGAGGDDIPPGALALMQAVETTHEPWLILCDGGVLRLLRVAGGQQTEVERITLLHPVLPVTHDSASYRSEIASLLQRYGFELIHVLGIARHGISLIRIARALRIPLLFAADDLCALVADPALPDPAAPEAGAAGPDDPWAPGPGRPWAEDWRQMLRQALPLCAGLTAGSAHVQARVSAAFGIAAARFTVIPPVWETTWETTREAAGFAPPAAPPAAPLEADGPLRVFVPDAALRAGGPDLLRAVKALDAENRIAFHVTGPGDAATGAEEIGQGLPDPAGDAPLPGPVRPDVALLLPGGPQDGGRALAALWSAGMPVLAAAGDAVADDLAAHGGGWICDGMDAQGLHDALAALAQDAGAVAAARDRVQGWQTGFGRDYSPAVRAACHRRLYRQLLRSTPGRVAGAMVLALGGQPDAFVPTAHLRHAIAPVLGPCDPAVWPAAALRLLGWLGLPDILVIRYHDEPGGPDDPCRALAAARALPGGMKLVLELAADAVAGPPSGPPSADAMALRPVLAWLLDHADLVIGPAERVQDAALPAAIDLTRIVPNPADHGRLPAAVPAAGPALLPPQTLLYDAQVAARMDAEVLPGSSACIHRHNAPLVAANFTLIDWDAMLARPRVPGLVSLVMPTFNRAELTETFLRSILGVTAGDTAYEIIVLDNGSDPGAQARTAALAALDARVRVICTQMPLMFAVGSNYGASFARGEYLLFLNNDMEAVEPGWLDALLAPLKASAQVGITGGRLLFGDRTVQHAGLVFAAQSDLAYHAYLGADPEAAHVRKPREMQAVTGACMAMRAADWAKLRGFNPLFVNGCEDVDICLRMARILHRRVLYVPAALLIHHEGKSPGRGRYILHNRQVFSRLWHGTIRPDDAELYREDGFTSLAYVDNNDLWLAPAVRRMSVRLE
jgi:GT2 family glycosyltransferase